MPEKSGRTMLAEGWTYSEVEEPRLGRLLSPARIDVVVGEILANSRVSALNTNEPCDEPDGKKRKARRIVFSLEPLSEKACIAMDWLLNGAGGLRASYAADAESGVAANRTICLAIADALEAERLPIDPRYNAKTKAAFRAGIRAALCRDSAKVWYDSPTDKATGVSVLDGQIECAAWREGRQRADQLPEMLELSPGQVSVARLKGRYVPRPRALDCKGAFLDPNEEVYVPASKRTRAHQIHLLGWS